MVLHQQLRTAAAEVPGGFRWQTAQIHAVEIAARWQKVRAPSRWGAGGTGGDALPGHAPQKRRLFGLSAAQQVRHQLPLKTLEHRVGLRARRRECSGPRQQGLAEIQRLLLQPLDGIAAAAGLFQPQGVQAVSIGCLKRLFFRIGPGVQAKLHIARQGLGQAEAVLLGRARQAGQ